MTTKRYFDIESINLVYCVKTIFAFTINQQNLQVTYISGMREIYL